MLTLGPFRLLRPLAEGGMGRVWAAEHPAQRLPVAVKVLTGEGARSDRVRAALENEVRAVAGLEHPHIIWLYDQGLVSAEVAAQSDLVEGSPWLAMELAPHGTLAERILGLDWAGLRASLLVILEALAHAHSRGVVHRDLKPQNVLVREGSQLVLTDFGLAHALDAGGDDFAPGAGTPLYMAPEQIRRSPQDQGPWTDLYALGCMGWELATGAPPFTHPDLHTVVRAQVHEEPGGFHPRYGVAPGFEAWLRRLLEKAPEDRFDLAAEAAFALRSLPSFVDVRRPRAALPVRTDQSTWVPSTSALTAFDVELDDRDGPRWADSSVARVRPPFPRSWRLRSDGFPRARLLDAGRELFGLRAHPVVGRSAERDRLWAALGEVVREREPRVVLIAGPAGCGKSSLARWLCERAEEVGAAVALRVQSTADRRSGLAGLIGRTLGIASLSDADAAERLRRRELPTGWLDEDEIDGLVALVRDPDSVSAQERRAWTCRLIASRARRAPQVVWLDDALVDRDALSVASAATRSDDGSILYVLTYRDEARAGSVGAGEVLTRIEGSGRCMPMRVDPLPPEHWRALVDALLPLSVGTRDALVHRVEGNPLHAVQLVTDWVQRGALELREDGWAVTEGDDAALPSIDDLWSRRLDAVIGREPEWQRALELAAALGSHPSWTEWRAVLDRVGLPDGEPLVRALARWGLASDPGGASWSFAHAMLREALLKRAGAGGRLQEHHLHCASVLVSDEPVVVERRALHLARSHQWESAEEPLRASIHARYQAGDHGRATELVFVWREVAEALGIDGDDPRRGEVDRVFVHAAINALRLKAAEPEVTANVERARRLGWDKELCIALMQAATIQRLQGRLDEARRSAAEVREVAERLDSLENIGDAWHAEGWIHLRASDYAAAEECFAQALVYKGRQGFRAGVAASHVGMSVTLLRQERYLEALEQARLAEQVAEAHQSSRLDALVCAGNAQKHLGRLDAATESFAGALAIARRLGNLVDRMTAELNQGLLMLQLGRLQEARALLSTTRAGAELQKVRPYVLASWTGLLGCAAGDPDPADWERALEAVRANLVPDGEIAGLLTWIGEESTDPTRREDVLRLALDSWQKLGRQDRADHVRKLLEP